ncbi:MAG: N(2)-fixation sustaining protein CowN [Alphaproteobacteria bacterium]|nr:N(2)-fixation sustaining protein CowN [Alphaproteobacteria bacterium]
MTTAPVPERYVSFANIDFDGNMGEVLRHLRRYLGDPAHRNPLWERFERRMEKAVADSLPVADRLLLLHAHVYYMDELFEEHDDEAALAALRKLEYECF